MQTCEIVKENNNNISYALKPYSVQKKKKKNKKKK